ncbi:MAG: hypothetical protein ACRBN8_20440 [Nannocystales bacterium]
MTRSLGRATGVVLAGLVLAGCQIEPEYGVPLTATTGGDTDTDTDTDTEPSSTTMGGEGTASTGSSSTGAGSGGSTSISPDYGVPTTGES